MSVEPYQWALVDGLFAHEDANALAASYPRDHFKTVRGDDGEKGYEYEARSLIKMGAGIPSYAEDLSPAWRQLVDDLLSPDYRAATSQLTGLNLMEMQIEVNVFHYGPNAWLGAHLDLKDKVVTHVFYFNEVWKEEDGGCLSILRSSDANDVHKRILPLVGNSAVLVRSENSWHAVSRNVDRCHRSRRSMTVTFYPHGSISTMWPAEDASVFHDYAGA